MRKLYTSKLFKMTVIACAIGLAGSVHAAGFGGLFSSLLGKSGSDSMNVDETLVKMTEKMNRKMPVAVDGDTRLDRVSAEPGHQLEYHYTMLNLRAGEVSSSSFYKTFRSTLQKRVCAAKDLQLFFRNRISVAYAYRGIDGHDVGKLAFSPKDCGYAS